MEDGECDARGDEDSARDLLTEGGSVDGGGADGGERSGERRERPAAPPIEGGPPEPSNRGGPNLQCPDMTASDPLESGGFDFLSLSCYGRFPEDSWEGLREQLNRAQAAAQGEDLLGSFLTLGNGREVLVGAKGKGTGRAFARWSFQLDGIRVAIADRRDGVPREGEQRIPNVYVEMTSEPLMARGLGNALSVALNVLGSLGYEFAAVCPSRVDGCVDLVDVRVDEFIDAHFAGRRVCRPRKWGVFGDGDRRQTLTIGAGSSATKVRLYDKAVESVGNPFKYEILCRRRWGKEPHPLIGATRIEFQVRRDDLRDQHGIETLDDLGLKTGSLFAWLPSEWYRQTDEVPDERHTERFGPSRRWEQVIAAFRDWTGDVFEERRRRERIAPPEPDRLVRQAEGCLTSAAAVLGVPTEDAQAFVQFAVSRFRRDAVRNAEDVARKARVLRATRSMDRQGEKDHG